MQVTSAVNRSDHMMDCGRAFADIRPGRQRFATSALLSRKRCRDTDHQRELSLLQAVREAGLTQPDLQKTPQGLTHAGGKKGNVHECPRWTREGATGVLQDRTAASRLES